MAKQERIPESYGYRSGDMFIPNREVTLTHISRDTLYRSDPEEEWTLAGALALHTPNRGARVLNNGVLLAVSLEVGGAFVWALTKEGQQALAREHTHLLERWKVKTA